MTVFFLFDMTYCLPSLLTFLFLAIFCSRAQGLIDTYLVSFSVVYYLLLLLSGCTGKALCD